MTGRLEYRCDTCGQPVESGALHVGYAAVRDAADALRAWQGRQRAGRFDGDWLAELLALPEPVRWRVDCGGCVDGCSGDYWIDVTEVRSWEGLLRWTDHLSAKAWFTATDWTGLLKRTAAAHPPPRRAEAA